MNYEKARAKAQAIVSQMTADEKLSQLVYNAPAIERLGIKEYNWWNEALHGVARAGTATVFPQAIGLAATFNPPLVNEVASAISREGRAKYNKSVEFGDRDIFKGLTYWSPNINIFRDPRWGRGHETYGEDPFLTAETGRAFVAGLQGDGEFMMAGACSKHFAVHSGPEDLRHGFNAEVSRKDLFETYLPAFEKTVKAGVAGVMGAYSGFDGIPCNANKALISDLLRDEWGFEGYFVSDCGAIRDIFENHHYGNSPEEAAAAAFNAGCDLNCGDYYENLYEAYEKDLIDDERITEAAVRLFTIRALLGEFEEKRPYSDIPYYTVDCEEHKRLNLRAACESLVLLKNEGGFLPLDKSRVKKIGVVGPNSMSVAALEGNYEGRSSRYFTAADGIREVFDSSEIRVAEGSQYKSTGLNDWDGFKNLISDGLAVASESDITVLCLGLTRDYEGEGEGADKSDIRLPDIQVKLAEKVCEVCDNVIVVIMSGSGLDIGEKVRSRAKAIIEAWYPGALGGLAAAKLIAGEFSPCGRLPVTVYRGDVELPDFTDYSMAGRPYRFMKDEPLYHFGFGLGYSEVIYTGVEVVSADDEKIILRVGIENRGSYEVNEKTQVYASFTDSRTETPLYQLCGVKAVKIAPHSSAQTQLEIDRYWIKAVTAEGVRVEPDGEIKLFAGSSLPCNAGKGMPGCIEIKIK